MPQGDDDPIVDLIYDAIVHDEALALVPAAIARFTGSDSAWILGDVSFESPPSRPPSVSCSHGFDPDVIAGYVAAEHLRDPWMSAAPLVPMKSPVSMSRYVTHAEFAASPIRNEFLRGRMDVMHCMALAVGIDGRSMAYALQRGSRGRPYDATDEINLDTVRPHLVRLLRARALRHRNGLISPGPHDRLLCGPDPVLLCDPDSRIVHMNVPAEDMLAQGLVLSRSSSGRIRSVSSQVRIADPIRDAALRGVPSVHRFATDRRRHDIRIDPSRDGNRHAIIVVRDLDAFTKAQVEHAALHYGFTPAETLLARSLADGIPPDRHAEMRGLRMPTVRSQMSALLSKAGVERQTQLVSVILSAPSRHAIVIVDKNREEKQRFHMDVEHPINAKI